MDTKWRRFSRSGGFKAFLLLIVLGCAAAVGAITGYIPESNYFRNGLYRDVLTNKFIDSDAYAEELNDMMIETVDNYKDYIANGEPDNITYYYKIVTRTWKAESDREPLYTYYLDKEKHIASDDCFVPSGLQYVWYDLPDYVDITVGITRSRFDFLMSNFDITRRNMLIIIVSDAVLLIVGIAAFVLLCKTAGEKADGTVTFPKFFRLWFEPAVLLLFWYTCIISWLASSYPRNMIYPAYHTTNIGFVTGTNSILSLALYGLCTMGLAAVLTYLAVCIVMRVRNKSVANGFLIYRVFFYVRKALKFVGRGFAAVWRVFREFCTGELYKSDRAAKKFAFLDITFIAISMILFALALMSNACGIGGLIAAAVFLWVVVLGFFLYGRYLVTRDEARLEQQIREISRGNYSYDPQLSKNSPYTASCDILGTVAESYRRGIEESVKAERTKIELITNVSHDLKTPLTSIISYIDLLSREEMSPQAREYVDILQKKSERLKHIVSDVFELAKTTSGEISVEKERLDLTRLSNQTLAEMEDKINAVGLAVKTDICEPPVEVISDGKRLYRVIQNLMDNALKYSLKGTRIYYTLKKNGETADITIKNIAAYEMDFTKDEILERFSRGDKARTTEGSGLGLSIAQGFTVACGGAFDIDIDGDMFKVRMTFPLAAPIELPEHNAAVTADA